MAAKVLIYHMEEPRRQILEGLCRMMGMVPVFVDEAAWDVPVGLLSGNADRKRFAAAAKNRPAEQAGCVPGCGNPETGRDGKRTGCGNPETGRDGKRTGCGNPETGRDGKRTGCGSPDTSKDGKRTDCGKTMRGETAGEEPVREEMIVMCGLTKPQFDAFLDALRMAGIRIGLKAVETESNQMWSGSELQKELSRERQAFAKARNKACGATKSGMPVPDTALTSNQAVETSGRLTMEDIRSLAQEALQVIPERVAHYAPLVGVSYGRITIRNQRSRWGSCSSKGNLNFNCLLMLAPIEVIDSVVVHELCHRLEMNHSKRFYAHVRRVYPEYDRYHAWLKENGAAIMRRMTG